MKRDKKKKKESKEDRYAGLSEEEKKKLKAERKQARAEKREKKRKKIEKMEFEKNQPKGLFDMEGKLNRDRELTKVMEREDDEESGSIMPKKRPLVVVDQ